MPQKFSPREFHSAAAKARREAEVARYHASFKWHPLTILWPIDRALVRMADGRVVGATPRHGGGWWHSPHDQWGEPVTFAFQDIRHSTGDTTKQPIIAY